MNKGALWLRKPTSAFISGLGLSSALSVLLLLIDSFKAHSSALDFLIYNLALAILPVLAAYWLKSRLRYSAWLSHLNILITLFWLALLPNSFYMVTDFVHAQDVVGFDVYYQIVMIFSFVLNALIAGYISLYIIHKQLIKRFNWRYAHSFIAFILLACSFAIYLGRYLRWNSWDVLINPAGLLFDISDTFVSPHSHPEVLVTTVTFFGLLSSIYFIIWQTTKLLEKNK